MWKFPKGSTQRATYDAPSLQALLSMLNRHEDVSVATTDTLIVHYHATDGTVMEVVSHDKQSGFMNMDFTADTKPPAKSNVVSINPPKKKKPHIRLPVGPAPTYGGSGLYASFPA